MTVIEPIPLFKYITGIIKNNKKNKGREDESKFILGYINKNPITR